LTREEHATFSTLTSEIERLRHEEGRPTPQDDLTKFFPSHALITPHANKTIKKS